MYIAFINNADCPNRFSFDGHPSTFKFLEISTKIIPTILIFLPTKLNDHSFSTYAKLLEKVTFLKKLKKITCVYQGLRNVSFFRKSWVHTN